MQGLEGRFQWRLTATRSPSRPFRVWQRSTASYLANRIWANPDLPKIAYDLAQAASLLEEAGFTRRGAADAPELVDAQGNRVEFSLLVPAESEPRKLMAAVIRKTWRSSA